MVLLWINWHHGFLTDGAAGSCILGGAIFFGTLFKTPLSASVLALELTLNPEIMPLVALGGFISTWVSQALKAPSLFDEELRDLGVSLIDGRSISLLEKLQVKDAMVSDHEVAHPHDSVSVLNQRMSESRYPFIPVLNPQNQLLGILTLEMIQEGVQFQKESAGRNVMSALIEAKDMLYRASFQPPTIGIHEPLSATAGRFNDFPCLTVLGPENQVLGLLLVYHVRLAYDQEMIKRSFRAVS